MLVTSADQDVELTFQLNQLPVLNQFLLLILRLKDMKLLMLKHYGVTPPKNEL